MSGIPYRADQRLAFAVTRFIEEVHRQVPQARLEPMTPYEDEDFTLAVIIPAGIDEEKVLDQCLAASANGSSSFRLSMRLRASDPSGLLSRYR